MKKMTKNPVVLFLSGIIQAIGVTFIITPLYYLSPYLDERYQKKKRKEEEKNKEEHAREKEFLCANIERWEEFFLPYMSAKKKKHYLSLKKAEVTAKKNGRVTKATRTRRWQRKLRWEIMEEFPNKRKKFFQD